MEATRISPSNDIKLAVCVGDSRKSVHWKNREVPWSKLLVKCSETTRTNENFSQYKTMSKEAQGDIKDKGGFVGGHLIKNGNRKKDNILSRQIVTLDADNAQSVSRLTEALRGNFPNAAWLVYTTHSHSPQTPRLRIIIPLAEAVGLEKWEAVSRYIAGTLGIEQFDPTTFEASRLMFWPTTAADGEFFFDWQDGKIMEAETILSRYDDWQDVSLWPFHEKEKPESALCNKRKAPDPTKKSGIVGAFCNAYSVKDAIDTFLTDVYKPTPQPDRYTYKNGSTACGLVVYPDGYAFSHHATDPARSSNHGCNAFDLVRIHKFGHLDTDAKPDTPPNRMPSYCAMAEFAREDSEVKKYILKSTNGDFKDTDLDDTNKDCVEEGGDDWKLALTLNKKLQPDNTPTNLKLIFLNDPELKKVKFDAFRGRNVTTSEKFQDFKGDISDESAGKISLYIFEEYNGLKVSKNKVIEMFDTTGKERSFNPVKDFIMRVKWDNVKRIETLLIDYLGADDTPLNRAVTRKWLVAAVARVFEPGCKFDYVLTLPGKEGIGKSTFFAAIAGEWFTDTFSFSMSLKEQMEATRAAWIIEISEMSGLKRTEAANAKKILSSQSDDFRGAYKVLYEQNKRHCVFAATTNEENFLKGDNGDRRWWVVKVNGKGAVSSWIDKLKADVPQIWAEAYHYYTQGDKLFLSEELETEAREIQFSCSITGGGDLALNLEAFLDKKLPPDWETYDLNRRRAYFNNPDPLDPTGSMLRQRVSAEVILNEYPFPDKDTKKYYSPQKINALLERCKDWRLTNKKASPDCCYGRTRKLFERVEVQQEDDI